MNAQAQKNNKGASVLRRLAQRRENALFLLLVLLCVVLSIARPESFFTLENMFNILKQISIVAIVAIGQTYILITGGIDLSVGYSLGLAGIVMTKLFSMGMNHALAILLGLLTGVFIGFLNGLFITTLKLPPFIVTLGTANIARGLTYIITKGFPITLENEFVYWLGNGYLGYVPIMSLIMVLLAVVFSYVLSSTSFGNRILSIGGNETAALLSGIPVRRYKILVYTLTGLLCGIGGIVLTGRLNAGNPNAGLNFDMDSIAAAIVGGTALSGGEGSVLGSVIGALLLGVIRTGLVLMNVNMYWQTVVVGAIIIVVCAADTFAQSKRR